MQFKHLLLVSFLVVTAHSVAQIQVKGRIQDSKDEALPGVTVSLTKDDQVEGAITDENGRFDILLADTGDYQLELRYVGFKTYRQMLKIEEYRTYTLGDIKIKEDELELQTVEIIGRAQQDYTSDYSFSATKTGIKNKELPQALIAITKELITDRQAFQVADAVKTVSGVSNSSFYNHFNIRGISQNESGQILNGMRTRQFYFLQPITSNIERVEVLKGPASVTFSSVDPGGSINMVTKKPLDEDRKEVSMSVGSFSTLRGALDFTGPLDKKGKVLYRLNAGLQRAESFRDLVQNNAVLVSPSISYIPDENTAINVEMIYSNSLGSLDRGQPIFGAVPGETDLNSTPIRLNLGATNDFFQSEQWIMTTSLSKKFSEKISFNGAYMKQTWREDLQEHRANGFAIDSSGNSIDNLVDMRFSERQQFWDVDNLNAYFNFDFESGSIGHKLLVGYDVHRWHRANGGGQNSARGFLLNDGTATRSYDPADGADFQIVEIDGVRLPRPNVEHFNLSNPSNPIRNVRDYVMNSIFAIPANLSVTHAAYIQEQVKFGKFTALLSARYEWFEDITNFDQVGEQTFRNEAFIPRVGLSYALTKNINVYGTYLEGFQPQSNTVDLMPNTENFFWNPNSAAQFDPLISDLREIGAKGTFFNGDVTMSVAFYEINQENVLIPSEQDPDLLVQRGADRSRGFEWDLAGHIFPNLQVNASYSFINAEIVEDADETLIGERKENTPRNNANLWMRYDFNTNSPLKGLGFGLGVQHSGDRVPWFTRDFIIPSFTLFDAAVYYQPTHSNIQLMVKMNNLLDETHWVGAMNYARLFPGAPRNSLLTVIYKF
ncbi:TonB-dependent receptor [Fulvivirga sp. M361]|uniref:TonB-dependent siderophore receptor n=1 Tax=Fulvivirga sp. M361 TaxID=2594266 RepID=UPI00117A505D|nr:TonB-dependent siderophore receptor [Fulvivirga sp. M361]TRX59186.1 TonB-dependent receptor [Fulvivirga sp. M361]